MTTRDIRFQALSAAHQEIARNGADFLRLAEIVESGGGSDAADITVAASPSNYTAAAGNVEAHLEGIDDGLGGGGAFSGARVNFVGEGDISLTASSNITMTWANEEYDVGGWFDAVADNTIFTVPADVNYVNVLATLKVFNNQITTGEHTNYKADFRYYNGASTVSPTQTMIYWDGGNPAYFVRVHAHAVLRLLLTNFPVSEGDTFLVRGHLEASSMGPAAVEDVAQTSFAIQAVG